jgi:hypothetical protein
MIGVFAVFAVFVVLVVFVEFVVFVMLGVFAMLGVSAALGLFVCLHVYSICVFVFVMFAWVEFSALQLPLSRDCSKEHS